MVVLGELTAGSVPYGKKPLHLAGIHFVKQVHEGIVLAVIELGQPGVAELVFWGGRVAVMAFRKLTKNFGIVLVKVGRLRIIALGRVFLEIFLQGVE